MKKLSGVICGNGIVQESSIEEEVMVEAWKDSGDGEKSVCWGGERNISRR